LSPTVDNNKNRFVFCRATVLPGQIYLQVAQNVSVEDVRHCMKTNCARKLSPTNLTIIKNSDGAGAPKTSDIGAANRHPSQRFPSVIVANSSNPGEARQTTPQEIIENRHIRGE